MELLTGDAVDLVHLVSHHPAQQVDAMDALVHQAAAVLRPGAPPRGLIVVVPVTVPADVDAAVGEFAEAPPLYGMAQLLHRHVEAVLVAGGHLDVLFLAAADDLVRVVHAHGHGLFDDDVHPRVDTGEGDLGVDAALRGDGGQLQVGMLGQQLFVVRVAGDGIVVLEVILGQQLLHLLRQHVAHSDDVQLVVQGGLHVVDRDAAAADQCVSHGISLFSFMALS